MSCRISNLLILTIRSDLCEVTGASRAYHEHVIHALRPSATSTLNSLRQRLAPSQRNILRDLGPQDQVRLLGSLDAAEAAPQKAYFDAAANQQAKNEYYGDLPTRMQRLNPQEAYQELSKLVHDTHQHELDYAPSQNLYPVVDRRPDGQVRSIYAGENSQGVSPQALIVDDMQRDNEARRNQARGGPSADFHYNCEHVVPQSWFNKKSPMRGDLHHLFACDVQCNSQRGNSLYIDFPQEVEGECGISSSDHSHFEPAQGKGAVARATLYFLLRYPGQIGDEKNEYTAGDIDMLLKWHHQDPPSPYELHRNAEIALKQGNRNPLVDFPEWADRIDFKEGLGDWGHSHREASLIPQDYILSCPPTRPFSRLAH